MSKKGALELSITAIVILIIAITILGLGIGFIKKQFTTGTELVGGKLTEIKEQMKEDIRTSGELLVWNMPETEVNIGKPQDLLIGVKNTLRNAAGGDRVCFWIEVRCLRAFNPENSCPGEAQNVLVGGGIPGGEEMTYNWFSSLLSEFDVKNFDAEVFPATMLVREAQPDRYSMEINVYNDVNKNDCSNQEGPTERPYASKSFTVSVK